MRRFLFALLVLLLPTQIGYHFWPPWAVVNGIRVDYLAPTLYLTDIITLLLILLAKPKFSVSWPLGGILTLVCINIFFSTSPALTMYAWLKVAEFVLLARAVYQNRMVFAPLAIKLLPFTLLWSGLLSIAQWLHGGSINGLMYWLGERSFTTQTPGIALTKIMNTVSLRPYSTLPHPNALAGFTAVMWLFLMKTHKKDLLFWVTTTVFLITLFLTESYSAWIGFIMCLIYLFFEHFIGIQKKTVWILCLSATCIVSLSTLFFVRLPPLALLKNSNARERMELLYLSGLSISQKPIQGTGLGTFTTQIPRFTTKLPDIYRIRATSWLQPVHNIPLLVLSETGLTGLLASFIFLTLLPISVPFMFILETSLFDHYWITLQAPSLLFALLAALLYNSGK